MGILLSKTTSQSGSRFIPETLVFGMNLPQGGAEGRGRSRGLRGPTCHGVFPSLPLASLVPRRDMSPFSLALVFW